jgi:acetoin utilization deacetylase AcuC-like enzyme
MLIFHSPASVSHTPDWYAVDGEVKPAPESAARVEAILKALQLAGGGKAHAFSEPKLDPTKSILATHEPAMVEYLQAIYPLWKAEFGEMDVMPDTFVPRGKNAKLPSRRQSQAGYWCFDMAAPINAGTWTAAYGSAACAVSAADHVIRQVNMHPKPPKPHAAYALCRPPGHHAGRDYFGGFCYLNNIAIAATHILNNFALPRVAILDIDYHHGNGTQDIFWDNPRVLTCSIHADPNHMYPYFWGHGDEKGGPKAPDSNFNQPLPRGSFPETWFEALEAALFRIKNFGPAALLVSLGVDAYEGDPISDFKLTTADFGHAGRMIARLQLPTIFIQEGGYNLDALGTCVAQVLDGFED